MYPWGTSPDPHAAPALMLSPHRSLQAALRPHAAPHSHPQRDAMATEHTTYVCMSVPRGRSPPPVGGRLPRRGAAGES